MTDDLIVYHHLAVLNEALMTIRTAAHRAGFSISTEESVVIDTLIWRVEDEKAEIALRMRKEVKQ